MYIGVIGCMGVGKTRLTRALEEHLHYRAFYEPTEENPYLDDFYADMRSFAFKSQIFVLTQRFRQHLGIQKLVADGNHALQDQLIFVDALYAQLAHERGTMNDRDYATYREHCATLRQFLRFPDVLIHLRTPIGTIMQRIAARGRESEKGINQAYVERLDALIRSWVDSLGNGTQVLPLDWTTYQPVEDVVRRIEEQLHVQLALPVR